jgi:NAD+ synthase (glutamine-hydrolysing)
MCVGSHHQLRKLNVRLELIINATKVCGGVYMYSNHRGCDGNRLYFDGSAMICLNGHTVAQASQFSLKDVEVVTATIDLNDVKSYRNATASFQEQSSSHSGSFPLIHIEDFSLSIGTSTSSFPLSQPIAVKYHTPEEECALGPACWLWDYLRRSRAGGFLLPLRLISLFKIII